MKKIALWSIGALFAFIVFVLAKLPAAQVAYRVSVPSNVVLGNVSGSIWNGRVDKLSVNGFFIDNVKWQIRPLALLSGQLKVILKGGDARDGDAIAVSGPISFSLLNFSHVTTQNLALYLPTDKIIAKAKLPVRVNMGGRFKLNLKQLTYGPTCQELSGRGEWLKASVVLPSSAVSLGNFEADLSCQGDDIQLSVSEPNLLGLSFTSIISPDFKKFTATGQFKPDESLPKEIHQAGQFFGNPQSNGYTQFKL